MNRRILILTVLILAALACNAPVGTTPSGGSTATLTPASVPGPTTTPTVTGVLPAPLYFIGDDSQVWRVEADGVTLTQVTSEGAPIQSYDVSSDGMIAYITGNSLYTASSLGQDRVLLFSGPVPPDTDEGRINGTMNNVVWSPSAQQIAFGLGGVNLYDRATKAMTLVLPSDPVPDMSGAAPRPEGPVRFYSPEEWSPDETRLIVNYGFWMEGGGAGVLTLADGSLVILTNPDQNMVCCVLSWSVDSSAVYFSNPTPGMVPAGLWRADATSGSGVTLIEAEQPDGSFLQPAFARQLSDGQLYYFLAINPTFPPDEGMNTPLTMTRSAPDGVTGRTALRSDSYQVAEALWDPNARGAVICDESFADRGQYPYTCSLIWLPADGSAAVTLPAPGRMLRWGQP